MPRVADDILRILLKSQRRFDQECHSRKHVRQCTPPPRSLQPRRMSTLATELGRKRTLSENESRNPEHTKPRKTEGQCEKSIILPRFFGLSSFRVFVISNFLRKRPGPFAPPVPPLPDCAKRNVGLRKVPSTTSCGGLRLKETNRPTPRDTRPILRSTAMGRIAIGMNLGDCRDEASFEWGVEKAAEMGFEYIEPMVHWGRELMKPGPLLPHGLDVGRPAAHPLRGGAGRAEGLRTSGSRPRLPARRPRR